MSLTSLDSYWSNASSNAESRLSDWIDNSAFYNFFNNFTAKSFNVSSNVESIFESIAFVPVCLEVIINIDSIVDQLNIPVLNETTANNIIDNLNALVLDPDGDGGQSPRYIAFNSDINDAIDNIVTGINNQNYPTLIKSFDKWIQASSNADTVNVLKKLGNGDATLSIVAETIELNNPNNTLVALFETDVISKIEATKTLFDTNITTLRVVYDYIEQLRGLE